ncbi:hypothetical protein CsSME_00020022 [Camellia sinensis var. sinensis]
MKHIHKRLRLEVPLEGFSSLQGISGSQKFQIHKAYGSLITCLQLILVSTSWIYRSILLNNI